MAAPGPHMSVTTHLRRHPSSHEAHGNNGIEAAFDFSLSNALALASNTPGVAGTVAFLELADIKSA